MPDASRPEAAARAFVRALDRALDRAASCVTTQRIGTFSPIVRPVEIQLLEFVRGPASLRALGSGPSGLLLGVRQQFAVLEADTRLWRVEPRSDEFRLLDHSERELLVYHWQPGPGFRGPDQPHVQVPAALRVQTNAVAMLNFSLDKRHLATGHLSLAMVVHTLIEEFGVAPLRANWQQVLERAEQSNTTR